MSTETLFLEFIAFAREQKQGSQNDTEEQIVRDFLSSKRMIVITVNQQQSTCHANNISNPFEMQGLLRYWEKKCWMDSAMQKKREDDIKERTKKDL